MSKTPKPPGRRHLTNEDEQLWEHMASSLDPLKKKKSRHHAAMPDPETVPPFEVKSAKKPKNLVAESLVAESLVAESGEAKPVSASIAKAKTPPALNTFDRKAARKLRQGQFEIEARIDLHGLRQHEAHAALRRFLFSSFAKGRRWVLVITGKGATARHRDDEVPYMGTSERGVLRRNVPMWLAEPELRAIVVSFTSAAISHGGDGALYIQLRNPDRAR